MHYCGLRRALHSGRRQDSVMSGDTTSWEIHYASRQCEVATLLRRVSDTNNLRLDESRSLSIDW